MVEQVNVKGKVIVPLPDLIYGMGCKTLSVNDAELKKALYSIAFTSLIGDLQKKLTISYNDKENKWNFLPKLEVSKYIGYAVLDTFETYHIVECHKTVNFTLGDKSGWSRPYDFGIYSSTSDYAELNELSIFNSVRKPSCVEFPSYGIPTSADKSNKDGWKLIVGQARAKNLRTTNAFIRKFGVMVRNPELQSWLDAGTSIVDQFTTKTKPII